MSSVWFDGEVGRYQASTRRLVQEFERACAKIGKNGLNAAGTDILDFLRRQVANEQTAIGGLLGIESPDLRTRQELIDHLGAIDGAIKTVRSHTKAWRVG
jgi:hypothetical protein